MTKESEVGEEFFFVGSTIGNSMTERSFCTEQSQCMYVESGLRLAVIIIIICKSVKEIGNLGVVILSCILHLELKYIDINEYFK